MQKEVYSDVLAERYASPEMVRIWSPLFKTLFMRHLWLAVMRAQMQMGVSFPEGALEAYEAVIENIDFDSIKNRELKLGHDVKANVDEFSALAGFEAIHRGMTSRDVTDNVEQMQIRKSMLLVRDRLVAVLGALCAGAMEYQLLAITGRSHNAPAQVTTLGKRFSTFGEELILAFYRLEQLIDNYPLRGLKGPMGTSADQLEILGTAKNVAWVEDQVARHLGFTKVMTNVGQVYPRSLDYEVITALAQTASGPTNFAQALRLMAGYELVTEGFKEGRVGSSAMPHKMNTSHCERIRGLNNVIHGFADMVSRLAGDQWQEGDVSCSVVRRVALPGAFFAMDGLIETFLTVLDEFGAYPLVIERELSRYMPFLSTTKILTHVVSKGVGREIAHEAIKEHAVAVALEIREKGLERNDLFARLGADERIPMDEFDIRELVGKPIDFIGLADTQVTDFCSRVSAIVGDYPDAAAYKPQPIL